MSLIGAKPSDLNVAIRVDAALLEEAMRNAVDAATKAIAWYQALPFPTRHGIYNHFHPAARRQSRLVTRRKQRNHW